MQETLPIGPLRDFLTEQAEKAGGWNPLAERMGMQARSLARIRNEKTVETIERIDELCLKLGFHPIEVYGDEW